MSKEISCDADLGEYRTLVSICVERVRNSYGGADNDIYITLADGWQSMAKSIKISFKKVCDLKFGDIIHMKSFILEITNIRHFGMEDIFFSVREINDDVISFKCKSLLISQL